MGDLATAIPTLRQALTPAAEARAMARFAKDPQINRQLDAFTRAVEKAPDLKTALRDPRVLGVLLPALGLADGVDKPGLAYRALTANPADANGLLAKLSDTRWKTVAETLNLGTRGLDALRDPSLKATLADGLRRLAWRKELDARTPGIADAMDFQQRAGRIATTLQVLGDPVFRRVVTGALGLPQQLAVQSVEAQARAVEQRIEVGRLADPKQAQRIAERYLVVAAPAAAKSAAPNLGTGAGIASALLGGLSFTA